MIFNIYTKYLIKYFTFHFIMIFSAGFFIINILFSFKLSVLLAKTDFSYLDAIYMSTLRIFSDIYILVAISTSLSILASLNKLDANNELLIIDAAGASLKRTLKPILSFTIIVSLLLAINNFFYAPYSYNIYKKKQFELKNKLNSIAIFPEIFNKIADKLLIYVSEINKENFYGIFVDDKRNANNSFTITAKEGTIVNKDRQYYFELKDGYQQFFDNKNQKLTMLKFEKYPLILDISEISKEYKKTSPEQFYLNELLNITNENNKLVYKYEIYKRIIWPFIIINCALISFYIIKKIRTNRNSYYKRLLFGNSVGVSFIAINLFFNILAKKIEIFYWLQSFGQILIFFFIIYSLDNRTVRKLNP